MVNWPKIFIIIVNWNGWKDTIECLESLLLVKYPNYKIIVIDNGSTDNSLDYMIEWAKGNIEVKSKFITFVSKKPIKFSLIDWQKFNYISDDSLIVFIKSEKNLGYSGGNNIGIKYALKNKVDFILILNNDTVVNENILTEFLSAYKKFGKACYGAKFYYYFHPGKIEFSGIIFDFLRMSFFHSHTDSKKFKEIYYAYGAGFFLPCSIIEEVGLFDERLLLFEENDLCCRIKRKGYKIILVPKAVIYHKHSSSFKKSKISAEYFYARSRFLWAEKNLNIIWRVWLFFVFFCEVLWLYLRFFLFEILWFFLLFLYEVMKGLNNKKEKFFCFKENLNYRLLRGKAKIQGFKDYIEKRFYMP
ncbi:MAG: glycosyltransferase [Candidatus Omnitrophica bacterium]|nr:glycosyltransferase [Candidatus Omnitrophota bacterium]